MYYTEYFRPAVLYCNNGTGVIKTPDITFDEIMDYSDGNRKAFQSLCGNMENTIPFVGAGLSAFVYPCWNDFLMQTARELAMDDKKQAESLIKEQKYEKAAGVMEKCLGAEKLRSGITHAFGPDKLEDPEIFKIMKCQAAFILPDLFRKTVLTTNFDRVLEYVYSLRGIPFKSVGRPCRTKTLENALRGDNCPCLFKFHGDVGEAEDLVLTEERYDYCYREGGELIRELKAAFSANSVLFLGCGLANDRAAEIFSGARIFSKPHYAVMENREDKAAEKYRRENWENISPIIYPPGRHEAVRKILEKLKETVFKHSPPID